MPGDILLSGEQAPTKTNPNPQDGSQRGTRGGVGARGGQVQYVTRRDGTTVARYTKKVSVHGVTANHSSDEEKQSVQVDGNSPISHEGADGETGGFQALARSIAQKISPVMSVKTNGNRKEYLFKGISLSGRAERQTTRNRGRHVKLSIISEDGKTVATRSYADSTNQAIANSMIGFLSEYISSEHKRFKNHVDEGNASEDFDHSPARKNHNQRLLEKKPNTEDDGAEEQTKGLQTGGLFSHIMDLQGNVGFRVPDSAYSNQTSLYQALVLKIDSNVKIRALVNKINEAFGIELTSAFEQQLRELGDNTNVSPADKVRRINQLILIIDEQLLKENIKRAEMLLDMKIDISNKLMEESDQIALFDDKLESYSISGLAGTSSGYGTQTKMWDVEDFEDTWTQIDNSMGAISSQMLHEFSMRQEEKDQQDTTPAARTNTEDMWTDYKFEFTEKIKDIIFKDASPSQGSSNFILEYTENLTKTQKKYEDAYAAYSLIKNELKSKNIDIIGDHIIDWLNRSTAMQSSSKLKDVGPSTKIKNAGDPRESEYPTLLKFLRFISSTVPQEENGRLKSWVIREESNGSTIYVYGKNAKEKGPSPAVAKGFLLQDLQKEIKKFIGYNNIPSVKDTVYQNLFINPSVNQTAQRHMFMPELLKNMGMSVGNLPDHSDFFYQRLITSCISTAMKLSGSESAIQERRKPDYVKKLREAHRDALNNQSLVDQLFRKVETSERVLSAEQSRVINLNKNGQSTAAGKTPLQNLQAVLTEEMRLVAAWRTQALAAILPDSLVTSNSIYSPSSKETTISDSDIVHIESVVPWNDSNEPKMDHIPTDDEITLICKSDRHLAGVEPQLRAFVSRLRLHMKNVGNTDKFVGSSKEEAKMFEKFIPKLHKKTMSSAVRFFELFVSGKTFPHLVTQEPIKINYAFRLKAGNLSRSYARRAFHSPSGEKKGVWLPLDIMKYPNDAGTIYREMNAVGDTAVHEISHGLERIFSTKTGYNGEFAISFVGDCHTPRASSDWGVDSNDSSKISLYDTQPMILGLRTLCTEFVRKRAGAYTTLPSGASFAAKKAVEAITPKQLPGYSPGENAYVPASGENDFISPYVGKFDGNPSSAVEVFSMGCGSLYSDPVRFYLADKEHFKLTLKILHSMRRYSILKGQYGSSLKYIRDGRAVF